MTAPWRAVLPWLVAVTVIVGYVLTAPANQTFDLASAVLIALVIASTSLVGAFLIVRVPGNPIGALLLLSGALLSALGVFGAYSTVGSQAVPMWPAVALVAVVPNAIFFVPIVIVLVVIPLIYPDGRLASPRFRAVLWFTVVVITGVVVVNLFRDTPAGPTGLQNPLAMPALTPLFDVFDAFSNLSAVVAFGGAAASLFVRFRTGSALVRAQTKWLLAVAAVAAVVFPVALLFPDTVFSDAAFLIGFVAVMGLPIAMGIAISRYRLYDIDRIVSRTIGWTLVTGVLAMAFVAVVVGLETVLAGTIHQGETLAVAASTLIVFSLFQPVRRRIQRAVDGRFDRARYDAERTAVAFAERLRDETDLDTVTGDLGRTTRDALAPAALAVWLRGHHA